MSQGFVLAGKARAQATLDALSSKPVHAIGLVAGAFLTVVVAPLWGCVHAWAGWHKCRARLDVDGLAALGQVLAPDQALADYRDGIWRGLFRVHSATFAFCLLQAPILAIAVIPVLVAQILFGPVALAYTSQPALAAAIAVGVPAAVALGVFTIVFGQHLLALKLLGAQQPPHRLGTVFHATGASWRSASNNLQPLVSLGLLTAFVGAIGGAVALINVKVADALKIQSAETIGLWIIVAVSVVVFAMLLEALSAWADDADRGMTKPANPYSFIDWFFSWLLFLWNGTYRLVARLLNWIIGKAQLLAVGTVVLVVVLVGIDGTSEAFEDGAWSGLAWFLGAAGLLLYLVHQESKGGEG
jgi:hypothetical protein